MYQPAHRPRIVSMDRGFSLLYLEKLAGCVGLAFDDVDRI
jgi:hypothetical protein